MNCYIKEIIIFNSNGEKRSVPLKPGLNIITGNSKTGKSALIEIVDYCLCSRFSQIPQGEIMKFGHLFCMVIKFPTKNLIVARKSYLEGGSSRMIVKIETDDSKIFDLQYQYFSNLSSIPYKQAQYQIEEHIGLNISNMAENTDYEEFNNRENKKVSLRDMTSFFFQHQNLIANKHALFYRFDDNSKRESVVSSFPIFAGIVDDNYFYLKRLFDSKTKELKQRETNFKRQLKTNEDTEKELRGYFKNYFAIIGKPFDEKIILQQLLKLKNNLPDYSSKTLIIEDTQNRYNSLMKDVSEKGNQLFLQKKKMKDIENSEDYANRYVNDLKFLNSKTLNLPEEVNSICPACGQFHESLNDDIERIKIAKENLKGEVLRASTYQISYVKEKEIVDKEISRLSREIRILNPQIKELEDNFKAIKNNKFTSERAIYAKARIDLKIEELEKLRGVKSENDNSELIADINEIDVKLKAYGKKIHFKKFESFLAKNMNKIGDKLDFEEQLKPLDFWFDLEKFSFSHNLVNKGRIRLSEMGSGANWLTCHLSLMLSFVHLFSIQKKSPVPSILFLDQPSQIYFPKEFDPAKDEDIKQVAELYKTIIEEILDIKEKVGYEPQIIVTDHADNLNLSPYIFEDYVRARWIDGKALI